MKVKVKAEHILLDWNGYNNRLQREYRNRSEDYLPKLYISENLEQQMQMELNPRNFPLPEEWEIYLLQNCCHQSNDIPL